MLTGVDASIKREETVQLLCCAPTVKCESGHLREGEQTPPESDSLLDSQASETVGKYIYFLFKLPSLSESRLNGFLCSRVGVCGLEILGRKNRDTKEKDRDAEQSRESNPVNTEFAQVYFPYAYIP